MPDRNRRYYTAIGGLGLAVILLASLPFACTVADIHFRRNDVQQGAECQGGNAAYCTAESNQADIRAADAADDAVDLGIAQGILNMLGIIGLGATVLFAHRAWEEARSSAKAAHLALEDARADGAAQADRFTAQLAVATKGADAAAKQASVSEDTAKKQLRAYVSADSVKPGWIGDDNLVLYVTLRNTGQTPAVNVRSGSVSVMTKKGEFPPVPDVVGLYNEPVIGGGTHIVTLLITEKPAGLSRKSLTEDNRLTVLGRVEYDDVFGTRYFTDFAFYCMSPTDKDDLTVMPGRRIAFREIKRA